MVRETEINGFDIRQNGIVESDALPKESEPIGICTAIDAGVECRSHEERIIAIATDEGV